MKLHPGMLESTRQDTLLNTLHCSMTPDCYLSFLYETEDLTAASCSAVMR